ncbi:MAG TPA: winged helix-turn-helix domain-containing protein [Mycobacteriales bacterium]|nr:winged helix-turn-helix domain-containing protein [Mycobacteriales bacterium]
MVRSETLSAGQARRIALAAQGFGEPRPAGRIDARHLRRVIDRMGLLQIDSINVLVRSHYLPVFSRLGPYPQDLLDRMSWGRKAELFEYWGHAASLIPLRLQPALRWRMERNQQKDGGWASQMRARRPGYVDEIRELVRREGPIGAGATGEARPNTPGSMWNWHDGKIALEYLFTVGDVMIADRPNFERLYDLSERVLPPAVLATPTPSAADGQRELVRVAGRALGVGTLKDLADYFRLSSAETRVRIAELTEAGELLPVRVEGWKDQAWLWAEAKLPRRIAARALLTPFDPMVWERARTERLFGFRYRVEIYTPEPKRIYGYYVLPFLLGDRLVGRIDLKADRAAGVLQVRAAWSETPSPAPEVAEELAVELADMARWLGLDSVAVRPRGDLAPALAAVVGTAATLPIG